MFRVYGKSALILLYGFTDVCFIHILLIPMLLENGFNYQYIPILIMSKKLFRILFDVPTAFFADNFSYKLLFFIGRILRFVSLILLLSKPTHFNIIIAIMLNSFAMSATYGKVESYLYHFLEKRSEERLFKKIISLYFSLTGFVMFLGGLFTGLLYAYGGYSLVIFASTIFAAGSAVLVLFLPEIDQTTKKNPKGITGLWLKIIFSFEQLKYTIKKYQLQDLFKNFTRELNNLKTKSFLSKKRILIIGVIVVSQMILWQTKNIGTMYLVYFKFSPQTIGYVAGLYSLCSLIGNLMSEIFKSKKIQSLTASCIIAGIFFILPVCLVSYPFFAMCSLGIAVLFSANMLVLSVSSLQQSTTKNQRSMNLSISQSASTIIGIIFIYVLTTFLSFDLPKVGLLACNGLISLILFALGASLNVVLVNKLKTK